MRVNKTALSYKNSTIVRLTVEVELLIPYLIREFSGDVKHRQATIKKAIQHKGFSFVDVFSPCVTYNKDNTYDFFRKRV